MQIYKMREIRIKQLFWFYLNKFWAIKTKWWESKILNMNDKQKDQIKREKK